MSKANAAVWKFTIPIDDAFEISMPIGAELLCVREQDNRGQLWARVVPERPVEPRRFFLRGTGHPVDLDCKYVGSFMMHDGALVFHLFEHFGLVRGAAL